MRRLFESIGVFFAVLGLLFLTLIALVYPLVRIAICGYIFILICKTFYAWDTPSAHPGFLAVGLFFGLVVFESMISKINKAIQSF